MDDKKSVPRGRPDKPVLVSACLLGLSTRYDGTDALDPGVLEAVKSRRVIPVCPEQLGGLSTPRPKAEIQGGDGRAVLAGKARVRDYNGADVTEKFIKGANEVLRIAKLTGATAMYSKERSPSCGVLSICRGPGVAAALLMDAGLKVTGR